MLFKKITLMLCLIFIGNICHAQQEMSPATNLLVENPEEILEKILLASQPEIKKTSQNALGAFLKKYAWVIATYLTCPTILYSAKPIEKLLGEVLRFVCRNPLAEQSMGYGLFKLLLLVISFPLAYALYEKTCIALGEKLQKRGLQQSAITQDTREEKDQWSYILSSVTEHCQTKLTTKKSMGTFLKKHVWIPALYATLITTVIVSAILNNPLKTIHTKLYLKKIIGNDEFSTGVVGALLPLMFAFWLKTYTILAEKLTGIAQHNKRQLASILAEWNKNLTNIPASLQPSVQKLYTDLTNKSLSQEDCSAAYDTIMALAQKIPAHIE